MPRRAAGTCTTVQPFGSGTLKELQDYFFAFPHPQSIHYTSHRYTRAAPRTLIVHARPYTARSTGCALLPAVPHASISDQHRSYVSVATSPVRTMDVNHSTHLRWGAGRAEHWLACLPCCRHTPSPSQPTSNRVQS